MKTLVLTGGGSAGHVSPNLALLPELKRKYALAYIGTDGIERGLAGAFGCPYYTVNCPKLVRAATPRNLTVPFRLRGPLRRLFQYSSRTAQAAARKPVRSAHRAAGMAYRVWRTPTAPK